MLPTTVLIGLANKNHLHANRNNHFTNALDFQTIFIDLLLTLAIESCF